VCSERGCVYNSASAVHTRAAYVIVREQRGSRYEVVVGLLCARVFEDVEQKVLPLVMAGLPNFNLFSRGLFSSTIGCMCTEDGVCEACSKIVDRERRFFWQNCFAFVVNDSVSRWWRGITDGAGASVEGGDERTLWLCCPLHTQWHKQVE
jgi:hypothetical protein